MTVRSLAVATVVALLTATAPAAASDPIMPLSQVHRGMRCTGLSVVQGTDISSFDVEVLDVVAGEPADREPLILVKVSGPAVDATGIAEGFSGSPVICPDDEGTRRNAGAIAFASGDYGGHIALVTPIESVLGLAVDQPKGAPRVRDKRQLAAPLAVSGLSAPVGAAWRRVAAKAHRSLSVAPFAPIESAFPPQQLRPGASLAVGLASGDVAAGAVGTVTYVDGDKVWGFGHPFDATGRRDLLLKDAYVYAVIGNPVGIDQAVSQKLAAPGHDLGTITADGPAGIAGRLGPLPARIPVRVDARDGDSGERQSLAAQVADESGAGEPSGESGLSFVGPMLVSQAAFAALESSPARLSGSMCVAISVRERPKAMRFCNTYVGAGGGPQGEDAGAVPAGAPASDLADALTAVDTFRFGRLHVTGVTAHLTLVRGLRQAYMLRARAPRTVRRGQRVSVRLTLQRAFGARFARTIRVRVPRDAPLGRRDLALIGTPADPSDAGDLLDLADSLGGTGGGGGTGPRSVAALARRIAGIHRYDGVRLAVTRPGAGGATGVRAYRDADLRLTGRVRARVTVTP
jgi:hypothetical protein